ncbi:MAG: DUF4416 family protein [Nitrospirae bacterium]|nr:DUF4416 family protein [Nitrospirota bacterium]
MLFVGILFGSEERLHMAEKRLCECFGDIILESPVMKWNYSEYYRGELGSSIERKFIFFERLINQDSLKDIKTKTNAIETELSVVGKRTVNLDPGYLTPAKVVLASTKDYSHRLYLGEGIFAEVTLIFKTNRFHPHINTYRDYQDESYLKVFEDARNILKGRLKKVGA